MSAWARDGRVHRDDYVLDPQRRKWTRASDLAALQAAFSGGHGRLNQIPSDSETSLNGEPNTEGPSDVGDPKVDDGSWIVQHANGEEIAADFATVIEWARAGRIYESGIFAWARREHYMSSDSEGSTVAAWIAALTFLPFVYSLVRFVKWAWGG